MKLKLKFFLILIITGSSTLLSPAQEVKVDAGLSATDILVGDQVDFWLQLEMPGNYHVVWPMFQDTLTSKIEILKQGKIDSTTNESGLLSLKQKLTLTAFDSGYYALPPVQFRYGPAGEQASSSIETEPYLLNVHTLAVDTSKAIMPIKGPLAVPYTFEEVLPWILTALLLIAAVVLGIYYFSKRKSKKPFVFVKPKPKLPPHEIALNALMQLKNEKLWQQGKIKSYHSRISEIIRAYIEEVFPLKAVESTTGEILAAFRKINIAAEHKKKLGDILTISDLVKFAKARPLPDEHEKSLRFAENFIEATKDFGKVQQNKETDNKQQLPEKQNTESSKADVHDFLK